MKPPKWSDEKKVAELVDDAFDEWEIKFIKEEAGRDYPGLTYREWFSSMESDAVEAARKGNFKSLADFFRSEPRNPFVKMFLEKGLRPSSEALDLVARRAAGEYSAKRGQPKQTEDQRRAGSKVHDAADEVPWIAAILKRHYRDQAGIRDRAIAIAVRRANRFPGKKIKIETLANYLKSNKRLAATPKKN